MIILDIFIGLVLIYFLYSLLASIIAEIIASWLGMRARILRQGIENILNDKKQNDFNFSNWIKDIFMVEDKHFPFTQAGKFYQEPTIKYLAKPGENSILSIRNKKPSYISSENFVITLLNMLSNKGRGISEWDKIKFAIETNANHFEPETHKMLVDMVKRSNDTFKDFVSVVQHHYEDTMDRIIGWYKRKIGHILFWLGLFLCITFNVDSIQIVKELENSEEKRMQMVALAEKVITDEPGINTLRTKEDYEHDLKYKLEAERLVRNSVLQANHIVGLGWSDVNDTLNYKKPCDKCVKGMEKYEETKNVYLRLDSIGKFVHLNKAIDSANIGLMDSFLIKDSLLQFLNITHLSGIKLVSPDNLEKGYEVYVKRPPSFAQRIWLWLSSWKKFIGILITALALTLGAQFWFDLLKKLVSLRSSGLKPEEREAEKKKLEGLSLNGDAITSKDPVEIAISENRVRWLAFNGVYGINPGSLNNSIEIICDKSFNKELIGNSVYLNDKSVKIEICYVNGEKANLISGHGYIYYKDKGKRGSCVGLFMNEKTGSICALTCGHVLEINSESSYFNARDNHVFINEIVIGQITNLIKSSFVDGAVIDISDESEINKYGVNIIKDVISLEESVTDSNGEYIVKLAFGDIKKELKCKIKNKKFDYTFGNNIYMYNMFILEHEGNDFTQGGDSGSLVSFRKKSDNNSIRDIAIGMVIASAIIGNKHHSFCISLRDLTNTLNLKLL